MVRYPQYPKYKPTPCSWLNEVPVHWSFKRLKNVATHNDEALDERTDPDFEIEYVDISSVSLTNGIEKSETLKFEKAPSRARRKVKHGDVIVSTVRTYLKAIAPISNPPDNMIVSTGFAVVRPMCKLHSGYAGYLLQSNGFVGEVVANSVGVSYPAINASDLVRIAAIEPPFDEQEAIARFLDFKTAQIDALIAKKQTLLEKLAEKRTALISHAVTKGLDPSVRMKDSGVVWVGKIPSHWTIRRLKDVGRLIGGAGFPHELQNVQDEELYFYKVGDLSLSENGKTLLSSPHSISRETAKTLRASVIPKESIVYAKIGAALLLNRRRMTTAECCIDNNMTAYVVNRDRVAPDWAFYWLSTIDFAEHVNPGAVPSFSEGYQAVLSIPLPPIAEQENIVFFLENNTTQIDRQVKKVEGVIERLLEYRSAIITNAVTGKIDVRDFVIPSPVEDRAI